VEVKVMAVLRDTDYEFVGVGKAPFDDDDMFYFKRRKYDDNIIGLKVLKYIHVSKNIVLYFNAKAKEKICVSNRYDESSIEPLLSALRSNCER
jgi:hypothetical protein